MSVYLGSLTISTLGTFFGGGSGVPADAILDSESNPVLDHNGDYILDHNG